MSFLLEHIVPICRIALVLVFRNSLAGKFSQDSTGIACLEQLVLAWADQFVGTQGSTYSGTRAVAMSLLCSNLSSSTLNPLG